MDITEKFVKINQIIEQIGGKPEEASAETWDEVTAIVKDLSEVNWQAAENKALRDKLHLSAIQLWNLAVLQHNDKNPLANTIQAKIKHSALLLINLGVHEDNLLQVWLRKSTMALKTARAWLDVHKPEMTSTPLALATEAINKRHEQLNLMEQGQLGPSPQNTEDHQQAMLELAVDKFKLLCYKAEALVGSSSNDDALSYVIQARDLLYQIPKEAALLSMICYNFGVTTFQEHKFDMSAAWLSQSYEVGKNAQGVKQKTQARTLRLLAKSYLEQNSFQSWQMALKAIGLANAEHPHPVGLYIRLKILLAGKESDASIETALNDILRNQELSLDTGVDTAKALAAHDKFDLALRCLQNLQNHFEKLGASDISVTYIEILLKAGRKKEAKDLAKEIVGGVSQIEPTVRTKLEVLAWDEATSAYEMKSFSEALDWFEVCHQVFEYQTVANRAKLYRSRAACLLALGRYMQAVVSLEEAEKFDPTSPYLYFLKYKVALQMEQTETAKSAIRNIVEKSLTADCGLNKQEKFGLLAMTAQLAHENGNCALAIEALENLAVLTPDHQQALVAFRCLTRLRLGNMDQNVQGNESHIGQIYSYIENAYDRIKKEGATSKTLNALDTENEVTWFAKIAWNTALKCKDSAADMSKLYSISCKLLNMVSSQDVASLNFHKRAITMAAAATLCFAKETIAPDDKKILLTQTLEHIQACRLLCKQIQQLRNDEADNEGSTLTILTLCECEAKIYLGETNLDYLIEEGYSINSQDPKMFENMAALAALGGSSYFDFAIKNLKVAIKRYLQMDPINFQSCSKAFHSLIDISLRRGSVCDAESKREAMSYFQHVCEVIENKGKNLYPEIEVVCLMGKAWNCGVQLHSAGKTKDGLQWCQIGLRLLESTGNMKTSYKDLMENVYREMTKESTGQR